jgi:hypothetical protein
MRIERKLSWQKKFYDFEELLEVFEKEAKLRAPNSWQSQLYYLRHYGLDFFLNKKQTNNLNNWPLYFDDFKEWLGEVKTSKRSSNDGLAYASRNNIIGAVNIFLDIMAKKRKCEFLPKCQKFPRHMLARRDADHVIGEVEAVTITKKLVNECKSELAADFFATLMGTGMRLGEGLGTSLADFFPGVPQNAILKNSLEKHKLKCFGYIVLESQVTTSITFRDKKGHVIRKPLKGRRTIDGKASRIIPILDKKVFNILARRYNEQSALLERKAFGANKSDYLLFDGLTKSGFYRILTNAYSKTNYETRTAHCCRHTFATNFAGRTNSDTALNRLILGHKDEDTTLGYVHLYEQIAREVKATEQVRNKIELIEECA